MYVQLRLSRDGNGVVAIRPEEVESVRTATTPEGATITMRSGDKVYVYHKATDVMQRLSDELRKDLSRR